MGVRRDVMQGRILERRKLFAVGPILLLLIRPSRAISQEPVTQTACQYERISAACQTDEVVLVVEGRYGRMRPSRCISSTAALGCEAGVLPYVDSRCSGRRRCQLDVSDPVLDRAPHGCGELKAFLELSYLCLQVSSVGTNQKCRSDTPAKLAGPSGVIAKVVTVESELGSFRCPWVIEVESGQTVTLTLVDFALWRENASVDSRRTSGALCTVYAMIRDGLSQVEVPICGGGTGAHQDRETRVYTSTTNQLTVTIATEHSPRTFFLIKYEANGCTDFVPPAEMTVKRMGSMVRVGCEGGGAEMELRCVGNVWSSLDALPNCTKGGGAAGWWDLEVFQNSLLSKQGMLVVVLVSVALLVVIIILVIGICCLCRLKGSSSHAGARRPDAPLDPVMGYRYGLASPPPGELKELYPMLSKQDREPPDHWERDYATTLQMRQMAHPSAGYMSNQNDSNFFPHSQNERGFFCPVHGPGCADSGAAPPPHAGGQPLPRTGGQPVRRVSSFRPRSDHIYEVPRFDNDPYEDDRGSPTLYHDLTDHSCPAMMSPVCCQLDGDCGHHHQQDWGGYPPPGGARGEGAGDLGERTDDEAVGDCEANRTVILDNSTRLSNT